MVEKTNTVHDSDFDQITDNIFIGTNFCCQTHFDQHLLDLGIKADISLEEERVDAPYGVDTYIWLPTTDHTPPSIEQLWIGSANIQIFIEMGKKIYVHCKNGHGRAPTLVAGYLMTQGKTLEEALAIISEKRKGAHINDTQIKGLEAFQATFEQE
jgi:atypical dual specificity phosphatase